MPYLRVDDVPVAGWQSGYGRLGGPVQQAQPVGAGAPNLWIVNASEETVS